MRQKYKKTLEELEARKGSCSRESDIRVLVDLAEQMRREGDYSEADMQEIIKKFDERIARL